MTRHHDLPRDGLTPRSAARVPASTPAATGRARASPGTSPISHP